MEHAQRTDEQLAELLEPLVDANSMRAIVEALSEIAYDKAEHITHAWQDHRTARPWGQAGQVLTAAAARLEV